MDDVRFVEVADEQTVADWQRIHNAIIPTDPLSLDEVRRAIETGGEATFLDRVPAIETSVSGREPAGNGHAPIPVEVGS